MLGLFWKCVGYKKKGLHIKHAHHSLLYEDLKAAGVSFFITSLMSQFISESYLFLDTKQSLEIQQYTHTTVLRFYHICSNTQTDFRSPSVNILLWAGPNSCCVWVELVRSCFLTWTGEHATFSQLTVQVVSLERQRMCCKSFQNWALPYSSSKGWRVIFVSSFSVCC